VKHINARDVLPPDLLSQVYEHLPHGGYVYFPQRVTNARIRRNLEIFQMHSAGKTITEISERMLIHRATVYRVLSQFIRQKRTGSDLETAHEDV